MKLWIARDYIGSLNLFVDEPEKSSTAFYNYNDSMALDESLFPEVTFENSPKEVELKLIERRYPCISSAKEIQKQPDKNQNKIEKKTMKGVQREIEKRLVQTTQDRWEYIDNLKKEE